MAAMRDTMRRLKLTVNEAKTRICKLPADSFDFLGYTIGTYWSWPQRRMVLSTRPSRKSITRMLAKISATTGWNQTPLDVETIVARLNRMLKVGELFLRAWYLTGKAVLRVTIPAKEGHGVGTALPHREIRCCKCR